MRIIANFEDSEEYEKEQKIGSTSFWGLYDWAQNMKYA